MSRTSLLKYFFSSIAVTALAMVAIGTTPARADTTAPLPPTKHKSAQPSAKKDQPRPADTSKKKAQQKKAHTPGDVAPPFNPYPSFYEMNKSRSKQKAAVGVPPPYNPYPPRRADESVVVTVTTSKQADEKKKAKKAPATSTHGTPKPPKQ